MSRMVHCCRLWHSGCAWGNADCMLRVCMLSELSYMREYEMHARHLQYCRSE